MNRRQFISVSSIGVGIGMAGCIANGSRWGLDRDPSPSIKWKTSEGHTAAMGGDWTVNFNHEGGDTIDTAESMIKPVHNDKGHNIDRDVSFMNHEPGNTYEEGDRLFIVIPESEPQPEFGESFAIEWTPNETEWYTVEDHLWGQNYREEVP